MPAEAYQIHALLMSPPDASVVVGQMPEEGRAHLGARLHNVYLSRESLVKIRARHADIDYFDLTWTPEILAHGTLVAEDPPSMSIGTIYTFARTNRTFRAVVKLSGTRCDMWLTAFYRINAKPMLRYLNSPLVLRRADRRL
ncbi:hypothetical protein [Methylobacterium phyllostachyos]|nr:hypothetical protein [Methylobacterium phyllostachyos]